MTNSNKTQLKYVTRNGAPDISFQLALKRQTATRTIKRALRASMIVMLDAMDRCQDDLTGSNFSKHVPVKIELEQVTTERSRNSQGMFITQLR